MLQFWKKTGRRRRPEFINNVIRETNPKLREVSPTKPVGFDDEGLFDIGEFELIKERSRLSKTLLEVLNDKCALNYFHQYMESHNALSYLICWLDIDLFKTDISLFTRKSDENVQRVSTIEHDSLSISTDCDSYDTNDSEHNVTNCDSSETSPVNNNKSDYHRNVTNNALVIFKKYIALEARFNIKCPEDLRKEIIENICDFDKILSGCFDKIQNYTFDLMEKEYFSAFLTSDFYTKHQIDVLTSGNVALDDILYNETALFYFMEYLEQENDRILLEFWIAATNFQQQLQNQKEFFDPIEAQNDAIVLYDKYFSLQAHSPLGLNDKVRFAIEQQICGENGLILDCFHLPIKIVEQILERNHLKQFLGSQLYYKYLSELINTIQTNGYTLNCERSPSECGSEKSFSTFLALELNTDNKQKRTDLCIDVRELCDPDALWKRKKRVLACGRVTNMGKFETDFEPEPGREKFLKIKSMVRKFVGFDENKRKEEMAWQVAEMIVKDITNVTLQGQKL